MNSSSKRDVIKRLKKIKKKYYPDCEIYIGIILDKTKHVNDNIKILSGKDVYKIVTNNDNSFNETLLGLKKCLKKFNNKELTDKLFTKCKGNQVSF